jgi:hypothetical protein
MVLLMALPGAAMTPPLSASEEGSAKKLEKALGLRDDGSTLVTAITVGQAAGR